MTGSPKPLTELELYNKIMSMIMEAIGEILGWTDGGAFVYVDSKSVSP